MEGARGGESHGMIITIVHGTINPMRTTIDRAGRVVVPKALRRATGLEAGSEVEIRANGGRIEMEPAPTEVRLERKAGVVVAVPTRPLPQMGAAVVDETLASLRARRSRVRRPR
jgi:AbrB family looped-hinge helix DNA binding protein